MQWFQKVKILKILKNSTKVSTLSAKRDRVPSRPSAQQASSAQRPKINSNQTKGWSQTIAGPNRDR